MRLEELGLIGNCQFAALLSTSGEVVWCCLPRFDSEPVFSSLLDVERGGRFRIAPAGGETGTQRYLPNTNLLETTFTTAEGKFRVVDFAPRFVQHDRIFHPTQIFRIVEPLEGTPRIRVVCDPKLGWSRESPTVLQGSNHLRYEGFPNPLRLTTDIPLSYLGGAPIALTQRRHLVLSWGAPIEESLAPLCDRFWLETERYWQGWVKRCNVPPRYQDAVIRSALALKLHCYEDTGAIVASVTTSLPEAPGAGRNWDYRYCWLRDAYYVLGAFRLLGQFTEREQFLHFLLNIAASTPKLDLAPLYRVDGSTDLEERVLDAWPGYESNGPVRVGNAAAFHRQNDIYGELALALTPLFMDSRFQTDQTPQTLDLLDRLVRKAVTVAGTPDAGIWEVRTEWKPQTFSSLLSWAAADRMVRVAERHRPADADVFRRAADRLRAEILARGWNEGRRSFVAAYEGSELDAALLQVIPLRLLPPDDPRVASTVDRILEDLGHAGWLIRYRSEDGLGRPTVAFILCTLWLVEALVAMGRIEEARGILERSLQARSPLGLLSEDYDPTGGRLWGNFPQAYSHVGLIHAAFATSPRWSEIL